MEEPRKARPSWAMPGGNKPSEAKRISDTEKKPSDTISKNDHLKNYKKNWDTSTPPKGGVAARLQAFKENNVSSAPVVKSPKPLKGEVSAWQKKRTAKTRAATKIQALVRAKHARKRLSAWQKKRKAKTRAATKLQALVRAKLARKRVMRKIQRHHEETMLVETAAAIKIQAFVRSALTRGRVCRMVDDLIHNLVSRERGSRASF